ncbi:MAG: 4Fe-4S binding protein [Candidatus Eisenbacteria bacterium]
MPAQAKRKVIQIDEKKCTGCGLCVLACAESAIEIIDGKAKLVSDTYCDGLGACLGECPEGALEIIERDAEEFDEEAVKARQAHQARGANEAHRPHEARGAHETPERRNVHQVPQSPAPEGGHHRHHDFGGCPSARVLQFSEPFDDAEPPAKGGPRKSMLRQWPVQIMLVPTTAPYLKGADVLIAADCVPFAFAGFHEELLKGRAVVVGCPKLDDLDFYTQKLTELFGSAGIKSATVAVMEVPCCSGLVRAVEHAAEAAGKNTPVRVVTIGIKGDVLSHPVL